MIGSKKDYGLPQEVKKELETNWEKIREEYNSIIETDKQDYIDGTGYLSDKLRGFPLGEKINGDKCLYTHSILDKIPRLRTAGFSILKPKMKIQPHRGLKDNTIRYHLGLITPTTMHYGNKGAYIKIKGIKHYWEKGKILKFDDNMIHEVHNPTNEERVILLFDVEEKFSFLLSIFKMIRKVTPKNFRKLFPLTEK